MKITETIPKVERTFTLELTEIELRTVVVSFGITCDRDRVANASWGGHSILSGRAAQKLYEGLSGALDAND